MVELFTIMQKHGYSPQSRFGTFLGLVLYTAISAFSLQWMQGKWLALSALLFVLVPTVELFRNKEKPLVNIAFTLFGIFYVAIPFSLLNFLVFTSEAGNYLFQGLLGFFILMWTNDTGAYLAGMGFGRTKLFERISPKKTWEGSIGGLVLSVGMAWVLNIWFSAYWPEFPFTLKDWMVIAIIVSVIGSLGDLVESMIKRSFGIKDSGSLLPGHGGILDRFDGVLLAAPAVFLYVLLQVLT